MQTYTAVERNYSKARSIFSDLIKFNLQDKADIIRVYLHASWNYSNQTNNATSWRRTRRKYLGCGAARIVWFVIRWNYFSALSTRHKCNRSGMVGKLAQTTHLVFGSGGIYVAEKRFFNVLRNSSLSLIMNDPGIDTPVIQLLMMMTFRSPDQYRNALKVELTHFSANCKLACALSTTCSSLSDETPLILFKWLHCVQPLIMWRTAPSKTSR